jgi:ABC-type transport system involved in cytochrome c biogenesis ATPase subunit
MTFRVVNSPNAATAGGEVLLVKDNWNDWFTWITQFYAIVVFQDGSRVDIGHVKIARVGMTEQDAKTVLPESFPHLDAIWFSMGQSENYYETLNSLGAGYRQWFLTSLRDCAQDLSILDQHQGEEVLHRSLLRDIDSDRVRNRFHRLANGDTALTPYAFKYLFPPDQRSLDPPPELTFRVKPNSRPPTNVHVLIGRNGVGKTRCFDLLSRAFLGLAAPDGGPAGNLGTLQTMIFSLDSKHHGFAGLVTVSFSPFDEYGPLVASSAGLGVRYAYVGLIRESAERATLDVGGGPGTQGQTPLTIKSRPELSEDFVKSVAICRTGARRTRWASALRVLEADPLFEEANVSSVADEEIVDWENKVSRLFRNLSSGHSVVLLTITKLVELVEEKSLVLIDEPEGHLHPPLLSAFVRALSDLLIDRNGVAIIATHSPVVLQEVPKDCVWILNRSGHSARADRPESETFGENVGVLTREVFGLEVVQTGFHRMITEAVEGRSYEQVQELFMNRLGGEAKALARALSLIPPAEAHEDEE